MSWALSPEESLMSGSNPPEVLRVLHVLPRTEKLLPRRVPREVMLSLGVPTELCPGVSLQKPTLPLGVHALLGPGVFWTLCPGVFKTLCPGVFPRLGPGVLAAELCPESPLKTSLTTPELSDIVM